MPLKTLGTQITPPTFENFPGVLRELGIEPKPQNVSVPETKKKLALTNDVFSPYAPNAVKDIASAVEVTMATDFLTENKPERARFFAGSDGIPEDVIRALAGTAEPVYFQIDRLDKTWKPLPKNQWDKIDKHERGLAWPSAFRAFSNKELLIVLVNAAAIDDTGFIEIHGDSANYPGGRKGHVAYWKEEQQ
jgi:hypothetical protein